MYLQVPGLRKPERFMIESLKLSKKNTHTCLWLLPSLSLSGVSVGICDWLGTFTGVWPKGLETATSPPGRTAAEKNGTSSIFEKSLWNPSVDGWVRVSKNNPVIG